jgi:hypothetical protein
MYGNHANGFEYEMRKPNEFSQGTHRQRVLLQNDLEEIILCE